MAEVCYPVFQEGQTLTRDDLNRLRAFLDDRDRDLGRVVGFGVSCGLDGTIEDSTLRIAPGLAVDQLGQVLHLANEVVIPLPPTVDGAFEFVGGSSGFTAVLAADEEIIAAPECDEEGCEGHASLTCRNVRVLIDGGQLTGARFDFSSEPLLDQEPLRIRPTSTVDGAFVALRDAILGRIGDDLSDEPRAKLAGLRIETSDLPAIKAFKAAFLNQVFFAALDYLRCMELFSVTCLRETATPGVALGWLHLVGGSWEWDCELRHAWEPPAGVSLAFFGGRCDSPCDLYLDRLEGMIETFEVPPTPAPEDPPGPGGDDPDDYPWCWPHKHGRYPHFGLEDCGIVVYPPERIPEDWPDIYVDPRLGPGGGDPPPPWVVYGTDGPEWFDGGVINVTPGFGGNAPLVADALRRRIGEVGVEPDVRVVNPAEAAAMEGYEPAGAVSPSDIVVIVADELGKVEATGRVSAGHTLRNAGTAIPRATERSETAISTASRAAADVGALGTRIDGVDETLASFGEFKTELTIWQTGAQLVLAELDTRRVGERLAALEARVESRDADVRRTTERVDQILAGRAAGLPSDAVTRNVEFNASLVDFLASTRRVVEAGATGAAATRVREALAEGEAAFARLDAQARAGALILPQEGAALAAVVDSLVGAVRAAGAPAAEVRELRDRADSLRGVIG